MTRSGTPSITFRAGLTAGDLAARTNPGESPGQTARRDLERYYALLAAGAQEVAELRLTATEAAAICDALSGAIVPSDEILDRLHTLTASGQYALTDMIERFHASANAMRPSAEVLREIGMIA